MSDLMFYGVLRMPYEIAMSSEISRRQFYDRVQEAVNRVEAAEQDTARIDFLEQWRQEGNKAEPHLQFDAFGFELWSPMREQLDRMIELDQRGRTDDAE